MYLTQVTLKNVSKANSFVSSIDNIKFSNQGPALSLKLENSRQNWWFKTFKHLQADANFVYKNVAYRFSLSNMYTVMTAN